MIFDYEGITIEHRAETWEINLPDWCRRPLNINAPPPALSYTGAANPMDYIADALYRTVGTKDKLGRLTP